MAYETKPNTGSIFKNDKKTTDQHPGGKGSCLIDGKEYWVSSWTNIVQSGDKPGEKYQALKFELKEKQRAPLPREAVQSPRDFDDETIPF